MKIISFLDSASMYGKELSNIEVCRTLKDNGHEIIILYNKAANKDLLDEISDFKGYGIDYARGIKGNNFNRIFKYILCIYYSNKEIMRILSIESPQYVIIPTEIELLFLFPVLSKFSNIPLVFRMGDTPICYRKKNVMGAVYGWIWKFLILPRIDVLVSISRFIKKKVEESGRENKSKDCVIYNFSPRRKDSQSNKNNIIKDKQFTRIGYIGRIVPEKGVLELVMACKKLYNQYPNVKLFLAGSVNHDVRYYNKITAYIKENNLGECISFVGKISNTDGFYEEMDIIASPSVYEEPLGNVLVEAKSHHKASIIFNRGGMPEIVEHKRTGYVCPELSVESLAEGIEFYLNNPNLIKEHGENAYRSIEELGLTKEKYTEKWLRVFN